MSQSYVELFNLKKVYPTPRGEAVIVDGFNLKLRRGEFVAVIGHSGCGKTTVLSMASGLLPMTNGSVMVQGKERRGPGPDRAVVFQSPNLLPWMTAFQNVLLGVKKVYPHANRKQRGQMVEYYLDLVGLADALHKYPRELSGGMQQRVGIARAFALSPQFLLLDEPFGRLDSLTRMELQDVLLELLREKEMTSMIVTHDVDEALYLSDRVVMMTNGPAAKVGEILELDFPRPRLRADVLEHPRYYDLRGRLISFLEDQAHSTPSHATDTPPSSRGLYPRITRLAEHRTKHRFSKLA